MKKQLFLYLFIFSLIINVFTYMYFTNKQKYEDERVKKMQAKLKTAQDGAKSSKEALEDANYFAFENSDNAKDYFIEQGIMDTDALALKVTDGIIELNQNPNGNPLTGYDPLNGQKFLINKIKILNNRWIIADFSNGEAWGDVLLKYFVDKDGKVTYETMQTLLYANTIH